MTGEKRISAQAIFLFSNADTARQLVAGVPAAARAAREAALAGLERCAVAVPGDWNPGPLLREEAARLAASARVEFVSEAAALAAIEANTLLVAGERLIEADALRRAAAGSPPAAGIAKGAAGAAAIAELRDGGGAAALTQSGRQILAATAKPSDGIVSRYINRPISQAISGALLRIAAIRPIHATWGTAAIALMMVLCLLSGTQGGLVAGALLFQAASIFDGVDGEIARATFRTSVRGAMLDSLVDAATNIACIGGVTFNLYQQGELEAALAGATGLALFAIGLAVIGRHGRSNQGGLTFNAVKDHFSARGSRLMTWLTWLTMRDFFALAGAVLIILGFAPHALFVFAVVAAGWLAVVLAVMTRQPA